MYSNMLLLFNKKPSDTPIPRRHANPISVDFTLKRSVMDTMQTLTVAEMQMVGVIDKAPRGKN